MGTQPDMGLVNRMGRIFYSSATFMALVDLGVFTELAGDTLTARELADRLGVSAPYLESALVVCAALGFVEREGDRFRNSPTALTYLVKGQPQYLGDMTLHRMDLWGAWGRLGEAIRTGHIISPVPSDPAGAGRFWKDYMEGHHNMALSGMTDELLETVPLPGTGHFLDVGGGAGSYAMAFCARYPGMTATVLDQEEALPTARRLIKEAGLSDRVATRAGDYRTADFGKDNAAVLFSAMLCQEPDEEAVRLMRKGLASLRPGGTVIVQDALRVEGIPEKEEVQSVFDLLIKLCYCAEGGARPITWIADRMRELGLHDVRMKPTRPASSPFAIVWGQRP